MSKVPIRNLYVMLAYANRDAGLLDDRSIGACDFERPLDLLARLLDASLRRLRLRGLHREYMEISEEGPAPRGAIDLNRTIARLLPANGALAWNVDELVADTPANRVLKCGLRSILAASEAVEQGTRSRLRRHAAMFGSVADVPAREAVRLRAEVPRGQPVYRHALQLARLALERVLPDTGQAGNSWHALLEDPNEMGLLFEKFVRGFADYELRGEAKVSAPRFHWDVGSSGEVDTALLPSMQTDVVLQWNDGEVTVCECKFYEKPLSRRTAESRDKVSSFHLYQLTAYLRAQQRQGGATPSGLLLYARVDDEIECNWPLEGFSVRVSAVNLTQPWGAIRDQLLGTLQFAQARHGSTPAIAG